MIADRECGAVGFAKEIGLPCRIVAVESDEQAELAEAITESRASVIVTNIHKVLRPGTLTATEASFVNLHYSLLPSFGGTIGRTPVKSAIDHGCNLIGVTLHSVSEEVDGGQPLVQACAGVGDSDTADSIMGHVFRLGATVLCDFLIAGSRHKQARGWTHMDERRPSLFSSLGPFGRSLWVDNVFWTNVRG